MAKKRRSSKAANVPAAPSADAQPAPTDAEASCQNVAGNADSDGPPPVIRYVLSVAVTVHFACLLIALMSNYAPSYLQGEMLRYLAPYLVTVHQAYGARPLELTHGDSIDFPLTVEFQRSGSDDWTLFGRSGDDGKLTSSRWHYLARIINIIVQDQPDHQLLSEITFQFVQHIENNTTQRLNPITAVRLVQPHVMSFDEDLLVATGSSFLIEDDLAPRTVFEASVVRDGGRLIGMLPAQDASRNAQAVEADEASS